MSNDVVLISNVDEFQSFVSENKRKVIFYGAKWCKGCTDVIGLYTRIAHRYHKRIKLAYVDVDASSLTFEKIPVFVGMYGGEEINSIVGADEETLKEFIKSVIIYHPRANAPRPVASENAPKGSVCTGDCNPE